MIRDSYQWCSWFDLTTMRLIRPDRDLTITEGAKSVAKPVLLRFSPARSFALDRRVVSRLRDLYGVL